MFRVKMRFDQDRIESLENHALLDFVSSFRSTTHCDCEDGVRSVEEKEVCLVPGQVCGVATLTSRALSANPGLALDGKGSETRRTGNNETY